MTKITRQFNHTQSGNWDSYNPSVPMATNYLNIYEGLDPDTGLPVWNDYYDAAGNTSWITSQSDARHGFWYLTDDVPADVGEVTSICIQFHHVGVKISSDPTIDIILYEYTGSQTEIARERVNMSTSGFETGQITFTGLSLTRDQLLNLGVYFDYEPANGASKVPDEYEYYGE